MSPAITLVALLASLAGWVAGEAVGTSARPWFVALVGGLVAAEVAAVRPAVAGAGGTAVDRATLRLWRRGELLALLVGVKALHVVTGLPASVQELGGFPSAIADAETVTAWIFGVAVWILVNATFDDLDAIERGVEEGRGSVARIRLRVTGTSVIVVAASAFGTVGMDGLLDLDRRASGTVPVAGVLYVMAAVVGLSRFALRAELGRWARDGADVDRDVADRWRRTAAAAVLAVVLVGAAVPLVTRTASSLPVAAVTRAGGFGDWLMRTVEGIGDLQAPNTDADRGDVAPRPEPEPIPDPDTPPWFRELVLWALVGMIFSWVVLRAGRTRVRRRREEGGGAPPWGRVLVEAVRLLWAALLGFLRTILGLVRSAGAAVAGRLGRTPAPVAGPPAVSPPPALPDDPVRARIYLAHRRFAGAAGARFGRRRPPETAREFAGRVRTVAPAAVDAITGLYESARYSDHVLPRDDAGRAEEAADTVEERIADHGDGRDPG